MLDPRQMELLLQLSRLGSMRAVADVMGVTTSTVSQQIAALSRSVGVALLEPEGRRVRLTPPGRRLAEHAVGVIAALEAARHDLDPSAVPTGTVRVASFATGVRRSLLPVVHELPRSHPGLHLQVREHEPPEALAALAADEVDMALTYDYSLAPASTDPTLRVEPLWQARWWLGAPAAAGVEQTDRETAQAAEVLSDFADSEWIVNSRHDADETALRVLCATAGYTPQVTHRADSLDLVQHLVAAGLGVALLPEAMPLLPGVVGISLREPEVVLRCFLVTRRGRDAWPPLAAVRRLLA